MFISIPLLIILILAISAAMRESEEQGRWEERVDMEEDYGIPADGYEEYYDDRL